MKRRYEKGAICEAENCTKRPIANGLCETHNARRTRGAALNAPVKPKARYTIGDLKAAALRRGGDCLSQSYSWSGEKYEWLCGAGHRWTAIWNNVRTGTWCPVCQSGRSEEIVGGCLELMFGKEFPKARHGWLRSIETGYPLELDGYCEALRIGFEYHGAQHYGDGPSAWKDNQERVERLDVTRRKLCWDAGVTLIVVPTFTNRYSVEACLRQIELAVLNAGLSIPRRWNKLRPDNFDRFLIRSDQGVPNECHELAARHGGKCLSAEYINTRVNMTWQCSQFHVWEASLKSIKAGRWCQKCYHQRQRYTLDEMKSIAKAKGGFCLSDRYLTSNEGRMRWQCASGHEWEQHGTEVAKGHWCKKCSLKKVIGDLHERQNGCRWTTNGSRNRRVWPNDPVPNGFWLGYTRRSKKERQA
jgi:hypothetical protein